MAKKEIKFGTSGWRGIISDDFTFDNVRKVAQAIADFIKLQRKLKGRPVIIGGDSRFLSDRFSAAAAGVMAANKIKALICDRDTPTPVIAFEIIRRRAAGGINFTASHNPPEYSGLKFSPYWGGPAAPGNTEAIESNIKKVKKARDMDIEKAVSAGLIKYFDPSPYYIRRIKQLVDFKVIKKSGMKVVADPLYATGRGYLDGLLRAAGADVTAINSERDVLFGGLPPEPAEENVKDLIKAVKVKKAALGVATDGDADRYGIIDSDGSYIEANKILPLLLDYLMRTRKWRGAAVRSVATSHMFDAVAGMHGLKLYETPVGFKYIGEIMRAEDIIIGGEESNGLTIHRHVPEKDGLIACLLAVEMVAREKKNIRTLLKDLEKKTGRYYTARKNYRLNEQKKNKLAAKLKKINLKKIGEHPVKSVDKKDGYKYLLGGGSWIMTRFSGTEPIVRLYAEAKSAKGLRSVLKAGEKLILS